jgi:hypothetical protein
MANENETFTISLDDDITINLDSISSNTGTYSITDGGLSLSDITISGTDTSSSTITIDNNSTYPYTNVLDNMIDPEEVDNMCKEYPALSKVWRNFKSVYDMVKQDYEGKRKAGELDNDFPF